MAQGAANINNVPEILKFIWDDEVADFQYEGCPYYAMVDHDTSWEGLYEYVVVKFGGMAGRSGNFSRAKQNKSPVRHGRMQVATSDNFALWSVDNKLVVLTRSQRGSLVRAVEEATTAAQEKFKRSTCWQLWGNGGGAVGQISAIPGSAATITLVNANDVRNFDVDDWFEFSVDDGTGGAGVLTGTLQVLDVLEDSGQVVFTANISTIPTLAVNYYCFHEGDYNAVLYGVPAYVPPYTPGTNGIPGSIWGMDRTPHPTRLGGHRFAGSQMSVQEEFKSALTKSFRRNAQVTHIFTAPEIFNDLEMSLEGQRRYSDEKIGRVGFTGIEFTAQAGQIVKVFGDPDIRLSPAGNYIAFGLHLDSWKLHTAEDWPQWLTLDGEQKFMLEENANAREGRLGGYGQHYTRAPGHNFYLELS